MDRYRVDGEQPASDAAAPPPNRWRTAATATGLTCVLIATACWLWPRNADPRGRAATDQVQAPRRGGAAPQAVTRGRLSPPKRDATLAETLAEKYDPILDQWGTETLTAAAREQMATLGAVLQRPGPLKVKDVFGLVADDFACSDLVPQSQQMRRAYADVSLTVDRWQIQDEPALTHRGAAGFVEALRGLRAALNGADLARVKFKLFHIEDSEPDFVTRLFYEAAGRSARWGAEHHAVWRCVWSHPDEAADRKAQLRSIVLERFEQARIDAKGGTLFADCTESALGANRAYGQQVAPGMNHWLTRITRMQWVNILGHHGMAVGDVNDDGLDDLYVCDAGSLPNRLYLQNPDGTLRDASGESGVDLLDFCMSALIVDMDGDGDQDLVVSKASSLVVAENDGHGRFGIRGQHAIGGAVHSLSAADFDGDRDLDIYACVYTGGSVDRSAAHMGLPSPVPYHDAENGGANVLLSNEGDFILKDVTERVGLNANNTRFSFAASWEDYDNDGDQDLYVANDYGRNNLYRNDGGRFVDVAPEAGVEDMASGMSVTWGDHNRDGLMDLYVANMFSGAGNRIVFQRRFTDAHDRATASGIQRMARGNTLFTARGDATFADDSVAAAVTMGRWAWASLFADVNNDGWQDLLVANGYVTSEDTGDL